MAKSKMTSELLNIWSLTGQIARWWNAYVSAWNQIPHDYVGAIDDVLRFLPRPADYLFISWGTWFIISVENGSIKAFFGALALVFDLFDYHRCRSQCQSACHCLYRL
jgi:hypothetical protein